MADPRCRVHKLVCDVALLAEGHVLLVKYRDVSAYDGQKGWFLPDDHLAFAEHPDDAVRRIARDQVGMTIRDARLAYIESFDGTGGPWHLVFHYVSQLDRKPTARGQGNVADAQWFKVDELPPPEELAHHGWPAEVLGELLRRA